MKEVKFLCIQKDVCSLFTYVLKIKIYYLITLLLVQITMMNPAFSIFTYGFHCCTIPPFTTSGFCTIPIEVCKVRLQRPISLPSRSHIQRYIRMLIIPARQGLLCALSGNGISRTAHGAGCCLGAVGLCCSIVIVDIITEAVCCLSNRLCVAVTTGAGVGSNAFLCTGGCLCYCGCVIM